MKPGRAWEQRQQVKEEVCKGRTLAAASDNDDADALRGSSQSEYWGTSFYLYKDKMMFPNTQIDRSLLMRLRRHYHLLLLALCLCTLLLSPAAFAPRHAQASSSPITVSSRTYSVNFPDYIDLSVSASDPIGMIVKASLDIVLSDNSPQELHNVPIGKVGHTISTTWRENTSGGNFVPPGSQVFYFWQFWDSAGNTLTDTPQKFATTDTRVCCNPWQHLSQGLLEVNWYNRPLDFGRVMLAQASDSIKHISSVLGGGLIHPINLWIYETIDDFHGSLAPGAYEWVRGVAFPMLDEASIVAVSTSYHTLVRDHPHALTHLIFDHLARHRIH